LIIEFCSSYRNSENDQKLLPNFRWLYDYKSFSTLIKSYNNINDNIYHFFNNDKCFSNNAPFHYRCKIILVTTKLVRLWKSKNYPCLSHKYTSRQYLSATKIFGSNQMLNVYGTYQPFERTVTMLFFKKTCCLFPRERERERDDLQTKQRFSVCVLSWLVHKLVHETNQLHRCH
jgi:hypothetical protein